MTKWFHLNETACEFDGALISGVKILSWRRERDGNMCMLLCVHMFLRVFR